MSHWLNISCAYTRGIAAYICKIWSFYDQTCHWEGCTQMPMLRQQHRWWHTHWRWWQRQWHTTDRAWLHRLISKWAKNNEIQHRCDKFFHRTISLVRIHGMTILAISCLSGSRCTAFKPSVLPYYVSYSCHCMTEVNNMGIIRIELLNIFVIVYYYDYCYCHYCYCYCLLLWHLFGYKISGINKVMNFCISF